MQQVKWLHFYKTGSNQTDTFYMEEKKYVENSQEHQYASAEEMLNKNTKETFNFWDSIPMGVGEC